MSAKNSIQVGIKMRPLLPKEKDLISHWTVAGNTISSKQGNQDFRFDFVFDQDVCNQIIFDKMAKHIVHSAVHGFNGTIFAYGQTASGKTYTMMGEDNNPGVMVLAAKEIFNEIDKMPNFEFLLRGGFIEIYNEKIYDLLNKSSPDLKIHESANGNAHVNCKETCITSEQQLLELLEAGNESRTVGEMNMNERSSRSHAIFRLIIESRETSSGDDGKVTQSVLNLVDLAGSGCADQTSACGKRFIEGAHINQSLLFLSQVISRLSESEGKQFINYHYSKLTRILEASLGGNAFTSTICTVTPTSVEETQSTLCFAMRAKTVKNKPHVNEIVSDSTMMKRLTREIQNLKKELEQERRKNTSQLKVHEIERRLGFTERKFINSISIKNSRTNKTHRRRTEGDNKQSDSPIACEMAESIMKPAAAKPISLKAWQIEHSFAKEQEETLSNGITSLREQLCEEQKQSRRENQELQSQLKELKYQYEQLQQKNEDLIAQNKQLEERLKSSHSSVAELKNLLEVVASLREEKRTLESQLEKKSNEIEKHAASFQMKLKEQTTAYTNLRTALAAKEAVKSKSESTVTTLQSENKNLSERLETLNELIRKRTEICDSANSSLETCAHSQNSPLARRSCGMVALEFDKLTEEFKEFKIKFEKQQVDVNKFEELQQEISELRLKLFTIESLVVLALQIFYTCEK